MRLPTDRPRPRRRHLGAALLSAAALVAGLPAGAAAEVPANDDYLSSLRFNAPGAPLPRGVPDKVGVRVDTEEATTQKDLFAPKGTGGGAELLRCKALTFGKTVWFDFHPDQSGLVHFQTAGFPTALVVYEFDLATSEVGRQIDCGTDAGLANELFVSVRKGRHYTLQVGGLIAAATTAESVAAGGRLELTEEFFADRDGDGVLDTVDKCRRVKGVEARGGCPAELKASAVLTALGTASGVRLRSLAVEDAPKGALVTATCRPSCGFRQQRRTAPGGRPVTFAALAGRGVRAGSVLEVRVTAKDTVGILVRYRVVKGNFRREARCIQPSGKVTSCS